MLRGVAVLMVVMFHFTSRYQQKYPNRPYSEASHIQIDFGWTGVYLFFMISGFIIYLTIQKKNGIIDFMTARLSRLVPPYWTAILLILSLEGLHSSIFSEPNRNDLGNTIFNILMVPDIFHRPFLDGVFWSLYVEVKFYIIFAVLWKFVNLRDNRNFVLSYLVLLFIALFHNLVHHIPLGDNINYFLVFWIGIAACKHLTEGLSVWVYVLIAGVTSLSTLWIYSDGVELVAGTILYCMLFLTVPWIYRRFPSAERRLSPLSFIGRISYSFYLIHQPVGYIILGTLSVMSFGITFAVFLSFVVCCLLSLLGYYYVERLDRPIANYLTLKLNQLKDGVFLILNGHVE